MTEAASKAEHNQFDAAPTLNTAEFEQFRHFIFSEAGIDMPPSKRALIQSRLSVRLRELELNSFSDYWRRLQQPNGAAERQRAINLLSTNETYFFREPDHFTWLQHHAIELAKHGKRHLKIWSAACSTGEEAYTIAIVLAEALGIDGNWQLFASDINTRVTAFAKRGIYPVERAKKTPPHLWQKYFLRGRDEYSGQVRMVPQLIKRINFFNLNLLQSDTFQQAGFDIIFLRNVLIYFNEDTKLKVLANLCPKIINGGHLLISHAETIRNKELPLVMEGPSRYRVNPPFNPRR
ncbi:CheR family methyltransferase [Iodobacter sp. CM08]|uniref:CheR family methyltransferase n=1 Tax=Iodobacter sp. CM08 TaxID=3085902 RepID=UPI00298163D0|nr:CheR family methyltransferase [Iodobacter sp. CM08]MDW5417634.1 CheR family methyltransferase [Iodobacter sp. CM08]